MFDKSILELSEGDVLVLQTKIEAPIKAAFIAPDFPIATVPTGIPLGIWTIDNKLSNPLSVLVLIGTPITGR